MRGRTLAPSSDVAQFALGDTIETRAPKFTVDPGLEPGRHCFQLEVINEAGIRSEPVRAIVEVQRASISGHHRGC